MKKRTLLSLALLLSACGQSPDAGSGQTQTSTAQFRILSLPGEVREVVVEVRGTETATASENRMVTATLSGGTASVTLPNLVKGRYNVVARAYDGLDAEKVVLYKGTLSVNFQSEAVAELRVNRVTSAILVNATGVSAKSNVLVARVGDLEARLLPSGNVASGTLQGVPTGRGIRVIVNGSTAAGVLAQQGTATVRLSEEDTTVTVPLSDVRQALAPNAPVLSGDTAVGSGQPYTLTVGASQNAEGPETLQSVAVDWGDGSPVTSVALSGKSAELRPIHTYTAPGNRTITVTVTNSAGLSSASSFSVGVLDTVTGRVTVDVGAEVTPLRLSVEGVPVSAERVQATFTAPASFGGNSLGKSKNSLGKQDLKPSYELELVPQGGGVWTGGLSLPVGIPHEVALTAFVGGQPVPGAKDSVTPAAGQPAVTLAFGGGSGPVVCPAGSAVTPISTVQGAGDVSTLTGQTVTVRGIVTLDAQSGLSGFFVQDQAPDSDPATSEGLFVYTAATPSAVTSGEVVEVSGTVREFFGTTQLDTVTTVTSCGQTTLPAATALSYPLASPDALERVEGMLVTVTTPMTVTNTFTLGRYGELGLSSGGRLFNPTNGQGGSAADNKNRTLILDDASSRQNPATIPYLTSGDPQTATRRAGDTVTGLEGVMHYASNAFKLEPTKTPVFAASNPRSDAPGAVGNSTLRVASANVLNYFTTLGSAGRGASNEAEFTRQKAKIVAELRALDADVITLMEIENNGETALDDLVAALNTAAGTAQYASVKTGKVGTDAIRVAMVYRPGKVAAVGAAQIDNDAVYSRPPVAQTFRDIAGKGVFTVVANHFKSKGSCPTSGDIDQGQGCWNLQRVQQAGAVLAFADKLRATDPDVLLLGDLNAYGEEDPIKALEAGGFESLNKRIAAEDRYSYQFDGLFGYLDHALASAGLRGQVTGITEWHINADEPVFLDYNVEFKNNPACTSPSCTTPDLYAPTAFRSSDHDPVLVGLKLTADADPTIPLTVSASGEANATTGQPYTLSISAGGTPETLAVDWGDGSSGALAPSASSAAHTYASAGGFTITVTAGRGADTATATQNVTVRDATPPGAGRLVISQVYGGGGNSGATFKNDFVELFNAGSVAVSTAGKSVQYTSAAGSFAAAGVLALPDATLAPGAYYLIQLAQGTGGTADLPTPDATGTLALSGTNGKIALAGNTDAVTGKADPDLLDFVGYGSANEFEGSAGVAALGNATAALRAGNGCTDTNQNGADFTVVAPAPRNSAAPKNLCP